MSWACIGQNQNNHVHVKIQIHTAKINTKDSVIVLDKEITYLGMVIDKLRLFKAHLKKVAEKGKQFIT